MAPGQLATPVSRERVWTSVLQCSIVRCAELFATNKKRKKKKIRKREASALCCEKLWYLPHTSTRCCRSNCTIKHGSRRVVRLAKNSQGTAVFPVTLLAVVRREQCPPPNTRSRQNGLRLSKELTTHHSGDVGGQSDMSTSDLTRETSFGWLHGHR